MEPIDAYKDEDTMAGVYNAWSKYAFVYDYLYILIHYSYTKYLK